MKSYKVLYKKMNRANNKSVKFNKIHFLRLIKIKTRLISVYILLILIPMTCVGLFSYYKSSKTIKDKISNYSSEITKQISSNEASKLNVFERIGDQIIYENF